MSKQKILRSLQDIIERKGKRKNSSHHKTRDWDNDFGLTAEDFSLGVQEMTREQILAELSECEKRHG